MIQHHIPSVSQVIHANKNEEEKSVLTTAQVVIEQECEQSALKPVKCVVEKKKG